MKVISLTDEQYEWFKESIKAMHDIYEEGYYNFGDDDAYEIVERLELIMRETDKEW